MISETQTTMELIDKNALIEKMRFELPILRARIDLTQDEVSDLIGISRQTYSAIETGKRRMTWNSFMSLLFVFFYNPATKEAIENAGLFPEELKNRLMVNHRKQ